ncbi:ABC transporter transmembrane domain-containing protein [candidate division CSSED10-310 bacterium]|uniref:ABC transporter transmembrane domain-containing protein n=1 Tax=candidate division CSSED10-310 bacterium TaxID=2855610 RepID=A0ABV6YUG1_UNCC1
MHILSLESLWARILHLGQNALWTLKLTWETNRNLLLGIIICHSLTSFVPLGLALTARGLVNAVVSMVNGADLQSSIILFWIILGLFLSIMEGVSFFTINLFYNRLKDELNVRITTDILAHAAKLDLSHFEDPKFQDIMERARDNTALHFAEFSKNSLIIVKNILQGTSLVILLIVIEPYFAALLIPIAIPYIYFQWKLSLTRYQVWHSRSVKRRWSSYFVSLMTRYETVPEVKLLDLAAIFIQKFKDLMLEFRDQDRAIYVRDPGYICVLISSGSLLFLDASSFPGHQ